MLLMMFQRQQQHIDTPTSFDLIEGGREEGIVTLRTRQTDRKKDRHKE